MTSSSIVSADTVHSSLTDSQHLTEDDWQWLKAGPGRMPWNNLDIYQKVRFQDHIQSMEEILAPTFFKHWNVRKETELRSFIWPHVPDELMQAQTSLKKSQLAIAFPGAYNLKGALYSDWETFLKSHRTQSANAEESDEEDQDNSRNFHSHHSITLPDSSSTYASSIPHQCMKANFDYLQNPPHAQSRTKPKSTTSTRKPSVRRHLHPHLHPHLHRLNHHLEPRQ